MKLTARQALEIGLELWEWLEETGEEWKYKWPKWKKYETMVGDCPLCEYDTQEYFLDRCSNCLIYWRKKGGLVNHCQSYDSPYSNWLCVATPRPRRFWAGRVAKLHREALERLEG